MSDDGEYVPPGATILPWPGSNAPPFKPRPWVWRDPTTLAPRPWLLGTTLLRGYTTLLGSTGGTGKTAITLAWALAVLTGRQDIANEHVFQTGNVWLITLEDDCLELERRIAAAMIAHNIKPEDFKGQLFVNDTKERPIVLIEAGDKNDGYRITADREVITEEIRDHDITLCIIDPLVKSHRAMENSNEHMDGLITLLNNMAEYTGAAFLLASHFRKSGNDPGTGRDAFRGGSALVDGCRIARSLVPMTGDEAIKTYNIQPVDAFRHVCVTTPKVNFAPKHGAKWFRLESISLGNTAMDPRYPNGDSVQAAVPWSPPAAFADLDLGTIAAIFDRLRQEPEAGWGWSPSSRTKWWGGKILIEVGGLARDQAKTVLKLWCDNGVFTIEAYKNPNRDDAERLILNEAKAAEILAPLQSPDLGDE